MKKITLFLILPGLCFGLLSACNSATPEKYFDLAVLNSNMMMGFANEGLQRELDQPSGKMVNGDKDHPVPMMRKEIIDDKIQYLGEALEKIKQLKETEDTKDMLEASITLHEYILPVYKNEYQQLAKLYDDTASPEEIKLLTQTIHDKYYTGFDELYNKLISIGKLYAEKHKIKVNWGG